MKRNIYLILLILFLSGCATYKFHYGNPPYDKGYVASRQDYTIPEYTVGQNNTAPTDLNLARKRFKKRRDTVEDFYKRMGYIQNNFNMAVWEPTRNFLKIIGGVFRLPFIAVSDYRYEHDPKYQERIKKIEARQDAKEEARLSKLKAGLNEYIQRQLAAEPPVTTASLASSEIIEAKPIATVPEPEPPVTTASLATSETIEVKPVAVPVPEKIEVLQELPKEPPVVKEEVPAVVPEKIEPPKLQPEQTPAPVEVKTEEQRPQETVVTPALPEVKPAEEKPLITEKLAEEKVEIVQKELKAAEAKTKKVKPVKVKPVKVKPAKEAKPVKVKPAKIKAASQPRAVIIAHPLKGFSPLKVQLNSSKSSSPGSRIIAYEWDFGDGDTSTKPDPVNTYYSGSFEPRMFTITLTVTDDNGNSASATTDIEVLNK